MPAAPTCTAKQIQTSIDTATLATPTKGHKGGEKWVITVTLIKYSWGDRLYALIHISDLLLCMFYNLCLHARSGIVIHKTKHKSINTWDSVTISHRLVLVRPCIMNLCLLLSPWGSLYTAKLCICRFMSPPHIAWYITSLHLRHSQSCEDDSSTWLMHIL